MDNITKLSIELLSPNPNQPRKTFDDITLNELSNSIKEYGILNPLLVIKKGEKYEIIAGERRYRAAKMAGLKEVPVIVKNIENNKIQEIALIENLQREGLNPIEEAQTYQEIIKTLNITEKELGEKIGKSQSAIANKIRLLALPNEVMDAVSNKKISERHARTLLSIELDEEKNKLLKEIIEKKLTVKELEEKIKKEEKESENMNNGNFFPNFNTPVGDQNIQSLNTMNMQSMAPIQGQVGVSMEETVMPTPTPAAFQDSTMNQTLNIPTFSDYQQQQGIQLEQQSPVNTVGTVGNTIDTPLFNQSTEIPVSQVATTANPFANIEPVVEPINMPVLEPLPVQNAEPIIEPSFSSEGTTQQNEMQSMIQPPIVEVPLFNQELNTPPVTVEVPDPVESINVEKTNPIPEDKYLMVENLLNQNGISHKTYSNENGHCIIIEI